MHEWSPLVSVFCDSILNVILFISFYEHVLNPPQIMLTDVLFSDDGELDIQTEAIENLEGK